MIEDYRSSKAAAEVNERVIESLVQQNNLKVEQIATDIILKKSENVKTIEQSRQIVEQVKQEWTRLAQNNEKMQIDIMALETAIQNVMTTNKVNMDRTKIQALTTIINGFLKSGPSRD